mgnify:CR=1 FL=1
MECFALGIGIGHKNSRNDWLDVYYPKAFCRPTPILIKIIQKVFNWEQGNVVIDIPNGLFDDLIYLLEKSDNGDADSILRAIVPLQGTKEPLCICILHKDSAPKSIPEIYLKLSLISMRKILPLSCNLENLFKLLPNVAWTNKGPIDLIDLTLEQTKARSRGEILSVNSIDKFPKMADFVVPKGIRIGDASRVRLGAHLGDGTTVMHEGFCNFNAGTLGVSMIEGRISSGVLVGEGSDLGGGSSTMGTLSGGGSVVISLGEQCLLGANAGVGIPLGDRCTIESGLYVTAGSKVKVLDEDKSVIGIVKARELANKNDLLFRRNSLTGEVECLTNKATIELNSLLHINN